MKDPKGRSVFHCEYGGVRLDKALKAGFDAHFVQISPPSYLATLNGDYSELVVKEEHQVLPVAIVYFK